jgi:hypothetical protein
MATQFYELRERLLKAGVAPRHVRRYLNELTDHLADLTAEEERAGRSRPDAESAALLRLGSIEDLAKAMTEQRQLRSWCSRAPWATFSIAPLLLLAGAYFVALFILWSGWKMFLPGADTPFGVRPGSHHIFELENIYFQIGRMIYFGAPVCVGWVIGLVAARQRLRAIWPALGLALTTVVGCLARVHAIRPAVPGGEGHVSMRFSLAPSVEISVLYALVILVLTALPYLIWRLQKTYFLSA